MAYFSNGTEGLKLDIQCDDCINGQDELALCPILHVQMNYNYDQLKDGQENLRDCLTVLVDKDGNCQMKPLINKFFEPKKSR